MIGILNGKGADQMLQILSPYIRKLYTVTPDSPRAITAQQLAEIARRFYSDVTPVSTVPQALQMARSEMENGLLVCGSLYLASEARKVFVR